jgi:adenylosuccinate synthase
LHACGQRSFPTELDNETGELLRSKGGEFGATTGRPRRCGWLDLPALKYSIMLSGVTDLIMTKADILSGFDTIKVCTAYKTKYGTTDRLPYDLDDVVEPVYTQVRGWTKELNVVRSIANLPAEMISYIELIEKETGVRIGIVSTGPDREQILYRN